MNSGAALYDCRIMHCRLKPKRHAFNYGVFMISFELDHFPKLPFLSHNRFNLFSIQDADHINETGRPTLRENLTDWLAARNIGCPADASIRLVTFPRVLGYGFNPVSFYYINDRDGQPLYAVAEVVNTFREMKLYLVGERSADGLWIRRVPKNFYVSPFSDPAAEFDFRLGTPAEHWQVNIDIYQNGERMLLSAIQGDRRPLTALRLLGHAFRFPLMSLKIIGLIHWQALLLWIKKVPYFAKDAKPESQLDVLRPHSSLNPKP
jgi:DUF1365 family protein